MLFIEKDDLIDYHELDKTSCVCLYTKREEMIH